MSVGGYRAFLDAYVVVMFQSPELSKPEKVAAANKSLGVDYSVEGDFMLRAHALVEQLEAYRASPKAAQKRLIRRQINATIEARYGADVCATHRERIYDAVKDMLKRDHESWNYKLGCFHEQLGKDMFKNGCRDCGFQAVLQQAANK